MSIYFKKDTKKWKAEIWFNSQRHGSKTFSKKALAEKWEREQLALLEERQLTGNRFRDCTYNEIYDLWLMNASTRKREPSLVKDSQMHRQYICPFIGRLKISEIESSHFQEMISMMMERELSKASINKVIQHCKAVFNHAFNNEVIARNPTKGLKQLRLDTKEMEYLSKEELDQFLTYTSQRYIGEDRWVHVLYLTLFLTGCRLGEVLGLEWHRIQFDKDAILIGQIWCPISKKVIYTTKGKKDRVIPLNSLLKKELGALRNNTKSSFLFSNGKTPIDPANFRKRNWEKDLKAAGVRRIRIHDARHTYASLFMMSDRSLYELKKVLGHSSVTTTERYAHLSNSHLAGVKDIIMPNIGPAADVLDVKSLGLKSASRLFHAQENEPEEKIV
jgi:integrase